MAPLPCQVCELNNVTKGPSKAKCQAALASMSLRGNLSRSCTRILLSMLSARGLLSSEAGFKQLSWPERFTPLAMGNQGVCSDSAAAQRASVLGAPEQRSRSAPAPGCSDLSEGNQAGDSYVQ